SVNLPDDVVENIFSFLPIKQAIQMGVTSKRLKKSWVLSRNLYFDREFARVLGRPDFIKIINRVFALHEGPKVDVFRLCFGPAQGDECLVNSWINKCVKKNVEELDFDFCEARKPFNISSDLLDAESIRVLKFSYCNLQLAPKLNGLRLLNTLVLRRANITISTIDSLLNNCLFLENLDIALSYISHLKIHAQNLRNFKVLKIGECQDLIRIDIDAPTLRSFLYSGKLCFFKIGYISQLNNVMVNFSPSKILSLQHFNVGKLMSDFSHVEVLTVTSTFIEALCSRIMDSHLTKLRFCLMNLKEFQLFMKGARYCNLYDIASFLKNCYCIERVFIDLTNFSFECGRYCEMHQQQLIEQFPLLFSHLKFITIKGFKFHKHELEMVKFFLQKAIHLENLALVAPKYNRSKMSPQDLLIFEKIFRYWRASPRADIVTYEHFNDRSPFNPMHSKSWH
ncbi:F-box domain-containing protein/FBD domain-containing protein, partial [Cephalotus follicularis]